MIDYIKEFLILCEYRNYQKTAEVLYIAPSTLSRHIQILEKKLDTILVVRNSSTFELTSAGKFILDRGTYLINYYDSMIAELTFKNIPDQKVLTVCSEPFNHELLFNIYRTFQEKHPEVKFNIRMIPLIRNSRETTVEIADIIITAKEYSTVNLERYKLCTLFQDRVCLISSRKNPVFMETPLDITKLANYPFLLLKGTDLMASTCKRLEREIPGFTIVYKNALQLEPTELYYTMKSGSGWSVFAESLATEYAHNCAIIPLGPGGGDLVNIVMAYSPQNTNPAIPLFERVVIRVLQNVNKK